jgi:hypothetical protein
LSACAGIPETGPVESQDRLSQPGGGGILLEAVPPPQGATPATIINGFLAAVAAFDVDYATARLYLTAAAAASWRPTPGELVVYADSSPNIAAETGPDGQLSAVIQAAEVGRLQSDQSFHGSDDPWSHDFSLVKDDAGEWRIGHPPDTLAIPRYLFTTLYPRLDAYFLDPTGTVLVPDPRRVPKPELTPATAIRLVLGGPSDWLQGALADQSQQRLELDSVDVTANGWVNIELGPATVVATLTLERRRRLAIQCAATLRGIQSIEGVRLRGGGRDLHVDNAGGSTLPVEALDAFIAAQTDPEMELFGLQGDHLVMWADPPDATPAPITADQPLVSQPTGAFALTIEAGRVAVGTAEGLVVWAPGEATAITPAPGDWSRVQFDGRATWALAFDDGLWLLDDETATPVPVTDVRGDELAVQGFRLAADGLRMAVIAADPKTNRQMLGLAWVDRQDETIQVVDWQPIRLWEAADSSINDVAWLGPSALAVIGSAGNDVKPEVHRVDMDGLNLTDLGRPQDSDLVALVTPPQAAITQLVILDSEGNAWRYLDTYRWVAIGEGLTAVAYPD